MEYLPKNISNEELLKCARKWIDILAAEKYQEVISSIGYGMSSTPQIKDITIPLVHYRSPFYPNQTQFKISDWRTARGGNPNPLEEVIWYESNEVSLIGAVSVDLPLNGKWSDSRIDFVLFDAGEKGLLFRLEEIRKF